MKTYPPRIHDKKKRVSKRDWPTFALHVIPDPGARFAPHPWRPRKGIVFDSRTRS